MVNILLKNLKCEEEIIIMPLGGNRCSEKRVQESERLIAPQEGPKIRINTKNPRNLS